MSTLKTNNVQVGQSATATNNFTLYQPSTPDGTVRLGVGNTGATTADVVTATSAGNVGIGTSSPTDRVKVVGGNFQVPRDSLLGSSATGNAIVVGTSGGSQVKFAQNGSDDELSFITHKNGVSHTEQARITATGLFQFNSGYGSVATAYGCRAWVNFNGTGTVAIRASGNVTSITDNGTGDYTVNFTNAMPDANYSINTTGNQGGASANAQVVMLNTASGPTTSAARLCATYINNAGGTGGATDLSYILVSVFR